MLRLALLLFFGACVFSLVIYPIFSELGDARNGSPAKVRHDRHGGEDREFQEDREFAPRHPGWSSVCCGVKAGGTEDYDNRAA